MKECSAEVRLLVGYLVRQVPQIAAQFSKAGVVGRDTEETGGLQGTVVKTNCKLHWASTGLRRPAQESGEMRSTLAN